MFFSFILPGSETGYPRFQYYDFRIWIYPIQKFTFMQNAQKQILRKQV